jgi:N-acetylneuraminate synthase
LAIIEFRNGRQIGAGQPPYIVAEFNTSHNGSVDTAKAMIDRAKECGCDCVKFQSWSAESLYSKTYYDANPISKRIVKKFAFDETTLRRLAEYCREVGVDFASTPYSRPEVDALIDMGAPFIKVSSMEINNTPYLEYISKTKMPTVMSTGMSGINEVDEAVGVFERAGNRNLCLLHCVSVYPADIAAVNLKNILALIERYPGCPIGFSDHTLGAEIAVAGVALGAALLEKHFTLDKTKIGMDNQMALEPQEMKELVSGCRNVYHSLGSRERTVTRAEFEQRSKMRRSIVITRDLPAGSVIAASDLDAKRPGTGFAPNKARELVGRVLKMDIKADEIITEEHLKE